MQLSLVTHRYALNASPREFLPPGAKLRATGKGMELATERSKCDPVRAKYGKHGNDVPISATLPVTTLMTRETSALQLVII